MILLAQLWAAIRQHPWISLLFATALVVGIANYPLWEVRQVATLEHTAIRQRGEAMLGALTDRARINADLRLLAEAQQQIEDNLATEEGMEVNLGYFYRLEKLSRVRLVRIDQMVASPPLTKSPYKAVPISLQLLGSYRNVLGFIRELETGPRILRVRSYHVERADAGGQEVQITLNLELLAQA